MQQPTTAATSTATSTAAPAVWVGPVPTPELAAAVVAGGGRLAARLDEADAVVWAKVARDGFPQRLPARVRWVQLPSAGIEKWLSGGVVDADRTWTSAAGAYGPTVAEHALALILAGLRQIPRAARATRWEPLAGRELRGSDVAVIGAGGIGRELIRLLEPFEVRVLAANRSGRPVPGATLTVGAHDLDQLWGAADVVVVAAPSTYRTTKLVGAPELAAMRPHALLVNVGRGPLVDTDALVGALAAGLIGGAALDVVDPEPLPPDHPLWREPRALVTPHAANPGPALWREYARRVRHNVSRFAAGAPLLAPIDPRDGY